MRENTAAMKQRANGHTFIHKKTRPERKLRPGRWNHGDHVPIDGGADHSDGVFSPPDTVLRAMTMPPLISAASDLTLPSPIETMTRPPAWSLLGPQAIGSVGAALVEPETTVPNGETFRPC